MELIFLPAAVTAGTRAGVRPEEFGSVRGLICTVEINDGAKKGDRDEAG